GHRLHLLAKSCQRMNDGLADRIAVLSAILLDGVVAKNGDRSRQGVHRQPHHAALIDGSAYLAFKTTAGISFSDHAGWTFLIQNLQGCARINKYPQTAAAALFFLDLTNNLAPRLHDADSAHR